MNKYISLIGLGVVGAPLAKLLFDCYNNDFVLLSSDDYLDNLQNVVINCKPFKPKIISKKSELDKSLGIVFICTKNYQLEKVAILLDKLIDRETIIVPFQNGLYSFNFFRNRYPNNFVVEGYAQGPNTRIISREYLFEKPGEFHIGTTEKKFVDAIKDVVAIMTKANVNLVYEKNIKKMIWKKLMLNVAGNYITALTGMDYKSIHNLPCAQKILTNVMKEFLEVASSYNISLNEDDIYETIDYFNSFSVSKKTSMLEDVINKRKTENEFIAGYVVELAKKQSISTPLISLLYELIKIKEFVYLNDCV